MAKLAAVRPRMQVVEAPLKYFVFITRLHGFKTEIRDGSVQGPNGRIEEMENGLLLCAANVKDAGLEIRSIVNPLISPRVEATMEFSVEDFPACCAALVNIGLASFA